MAQRYVGERTGLPVAGLLLRPRRLLLRCSRGSAAADRAGAPAGTSELRSTTRSHHATPSIVERYREAPDHRVHFSTRSGCDLHAELSSRSARPCGWTWSPANELRVRPLRPGHDPATRSSRPTASWSNDRVEGRRGRDLAPSLLSARLAARRSRWQPLRGRGRAPLWPRHRGRGGLVQTLLWGRVEEGRRAKRGGSGCLEATGWQSATGATGRCGTLLELPRVKSCLVGRTVQQRPAGPGRRADPDHGRHRLARPGATVGQEWLRGEDAPCTGESLRLLAGARPPSTWPWPATGGPPRAPLTVGSAGSLAGERARWR